MSFNSSQNQKGRILTIINDNQKQVNWTIDSLLFQCFELPCACADFFAVKTLRFTFLSIKLLSDPKTITTQINSQIRELSMTANLVLIMTTTGDRRESESGI